MFGYRLFNIKKIEALNLELAKLKEYKENIESNSKLYLRYDKSEIQSGMTRVTWAEGLIRQLPESHDGRNSWLLNYGNKDCRLAREEKERKELNIELFNSKLQDIYEFMIKHENNEVFKKDIEEIKEKLRKVLKDV